MKNNRRILGILFGYFMRGLLLVTPFAVTGYIISFALQRIDGLIQVNLPGLGIIILVLIITLLGYLGSTLLVSSLFSFTEGWVSKLPFIGPIYSSLKDLTAAFVGNEQKFNKPVLVLLNKEVQLRKLGFITQEDLASISMSDHVAVYVPHSYNFSGDLFLLPRAAVTPLSISSTEAMKFIISGGMAGMLKVEHTDVLAKQSKKSDKVSA